jgi:hypothetical protein
MPVWSRCGLEAAPGGRKAASLHSWRIPARRGAALPDRGTIAESLTVPACTVKATAYRRRLQVTVNDVETSAISSKRPRAVRSGTTSRAFLRVCKGWRASASSRWAGKAHRESVKR